MNVCVKCKVNHQEGLRFPRIEGEEMDPSPWSERAEWSAVWLEKHFEVVQLWMK